MTYEHPSHKAARDANAVPPVIDLTGWDRPAATVKSCAGQLALPGLEQVERQRKHAKRVKATWTVNGSKRKRRF
jgi:hypothetical protein